MAATYTEMKNNNECQIIIWKKIILYQSQKND